MFFKEPEMMAMQRTTLMFVLAAALAMPAAARAEHEHGSDRPDTGAAQSQDTSAAGMASLRERMEEMRRTEDPAKRMQLMEEQMSQMDTVMKDMQASGPMTGKKPGGMGMMGGRDCMGMMGHGMKGGMGHGMHGGTGEAGDDGMMARRMEMMEKRMDMMQQMMQMNMGKP
ncbi:MAG TPA: hypothetical protein PLF88_06020 [Opitutaceae bacterium]|nr:hypothetical protein [Opitutaceae bacterium]